MNNQTNITEENSSENDIRTQLLQDIIQKNNLGFKADEIIRSSKRYLNDQKKSNSKKVKTTNENLEYIHKIEHKLTTTKSKKLKMVVNAKERMSNDYLKQMLGIYKLHLRKITLIGYFNLDDSMLGWLLSSFPYLESIKFRFKNTDMNISSKAFYDFIYNSQSLYSLELFNPPASMMDLYLESISLRKLKLISMINIKSISLKLENLKIFMLDLKGNKIWDGSLENLSNSLASHSKNLATIAISCPFLCDSDMEIILSDCKKLEAISIHRSLITDNLFYKLQNLNELQILDIQYCDYLTDEFCDLISKYSKKLQSITLILSELAKVSNKGINSLSFISTLSRLKLKIPSIIVLSIYSKSLERLTLTDWSNLTYLSISCPKMIDLNTRGCNSLMNIISF